MCLSFSGGSSTVLCSGFTRDKTIAMRAEMGKLCSAFTEQGQPLAVPRMEVLPQTPAGVSLAGCK